MKSTELTLNWHKIKCDFTGSAWMAFSEAEDGGGIKYVVDEPPHGYGVSVLTITHPSFFCDESFSKSYNLPSAKDAMMLAQHMERNIA